MTSLLELPRYESIELFYSSADDVSRRRSGESDFGCWWYDGQQAWSGCWRISCVENTGEIYAIKQRRSRSEPEIPLGVVVVLGCVGRDVGYEKSHAALAGWENVCGASDSLHWVIAKLAPFREQEPATTEIPSTSLGELAGRVVLLLEALKPWDQLPPDAKTRCVELTLALARLPLEDPAYEQGYRDGVTAYAYSSSEPWAESGVQYVGSTGTRLRDALARISEHHNFRPPPVGVADVEIPL